MIYSWLSIIKQPCVKFWLRGKSVKYLHTYTKKNNIYTKYTCIYTRHGYKMLYSQSININGCVRFLINTLDTIVLICWLYRRLPSWSYLIWVPTIQALMSRGRLHSSLRGPSPHALILLGGARFIAWHLKRSFLGECRRVPRHFLSHRACLGYYPAPGPTLKKPWAVPAFSVGRTTNT